jgi:hypothetical protein
MPMPIIEFSERYDYKWIVDNYYEGVKIRMMEANTDNLQTLMMETCGYSLERYVNVLKEIKKDWREIDETGMYEDLAYSQETAHEHLIFYDNLIERLERGMMDGEGREREVIALDVINREETEVSGRVRRRLIYEYEIEEGEIVEEEDTLEEGEIVEEEDDETFSYDNMIDATRYFHVNRIENSL